MLKATQKSRRTTGLGGVQPDSKAEVASVLPKIRVAEPFQHAPLEIEDAQSAFERVLAQAGATLPVRDSVDQRVIAMVRSGQVGPRKIAANSMTKAAEVGYAAKYVEELAASVELGYITDPIEVGGYPEYRGEPYPDSDRDGLPDDWETAHGLNPNNPADATADTNADGYNQHRRVCEWSLVGSW